MKTNALLGLLLLVLTLPGTSLAQDTAMPGKGVTVKPGMGTALSSKPFEALFHLLLEDLGYNVKEPTVLSNPIFYRAVAQGNLDFWAEGWFPLQNAQLPDNFEEHASKIGMIVENGGVQGYLVSKDAAETYGITSLADFKRPEVKKAFDTNGDGKADLTACPPGWGCELVIEHHLDAYDLRDDINPIKAAYAASFADVVSRYQNGEPVLYYTWAPNFTLLKLKPGKDVVWINVPEIDPSEAQIGSEEAMIVHGLEGAVTDPIKLGFVVNDIRVVANNQFLEDNPAAKKLFELVKIPLQDISEMTARISAGEDDAEEIEAMAADWIAEHQQQVNRWLAAARNAAR